MPSPMISLTVDPVQLKKIIDRFENAPLKIQRRASNAALTAGANVVKKNAKAKAPSCLKSTIRSVNRRTSKKLLSKVSVTAGADVRPKSLVSEAEARILRKTGVDRAGRKSKAQKIDCPPGMWVEFGTYGNRKYKTTEPYAPATLRKKGYRTLGRSASPYWNYENYWTPAQPFMRPALRDPNIEVAVAKRLDEYLRKQGF